MMRLLSFFDRESGEYIPVGIFDDKDKMKAEKNKHPGFKWEDHEIPLNTIDKETIDMYEDI